MGIFNVHFPVMYGEGESAFCRLQIEIMAASDDPSLFDRTGKPGANSLLAASPVCFDPFAPPIIDPVPATLRLVNTLNKVPFVQKGIDTLGVGFFNMQERFCVNAQHPANYMAGAKIHCHGLEYGVLDVEETKVVSKSAREAGPGGASYSSTISLSSRSIRSRSRWRSRSRQGLGMDGYTASIQGMGPVVGDGAVRDGGGWEPSAATAVRSTFIDIQAGWDLSAGSGQGADRGQVGESHGD
jgi:hypothetical protein